MGKAGTFITYGIIAVIIVAILNRPGASIGLAAIGSGFLTNQTKILTGTQTAITQFNYQPSSGTLTFASG
jgi:hypothetical protein